MAASDPTFEKFPDLTELFDRPSLDDWREIAEASLKGRPLGRLTVRTHEGLAIPPLFSDEDEFPDPGLPGRTPHVRGRTALGAGPSGWSVCQAVAHPDPETAAHLAAEDLGRGADSIWLVFDHSIRTADEEPGPARGDGICLDTGRAFDPFFRHLDLTDHGIHLNAGGNTPAVTAALLTAARRNQVNPHELTGSLGFDPIGDLATDGALTAGLDGSLSLMAELATWTSLRAPGLRAVGVDTVGYHLAGASAVQELAYGLATAVEYLRAFADRDMEPAAFCHQLIFRCAVGRDLFMEAAKIRACRRLWSRATGACGVAESDGAAMIHAIASPRELATRDPWVNMLRTTVGSFAATVGGADLITVLPFDHALGPPDELGRRMATNTQTILREESHLDRVVDPGGGSWYLERLTEGLATAAWDRFQAIEGAGGMASVLLDGGIASELDRIRIEREHAVATGRDPVTGVSSYPNLTEEPVRRTPATPPEPTETGTATEELARLFAAANAPTGDGAVVEAAMAAAAADAAIGRLAAALRGTRDRTSVTPLPARREPELFERLRNASDTWLATHDARPRIFLANLGPISEHKGRATFAVNFFEAGGIETVTNNGFATVNEAVEAFVSSGTQMAVICSSDERYPEVVPELAAALEGGGARTVLLAGKPAENETVWRAAGVTGFIHIGCDQYRMLVDLLQEEGVLHV